MGGYDFISFIPFYLPILSFWTRHILCNSAVKESTCSAGDPGLIPLWGRYPGEVIDHPLQYSWASLVTQLVKNPPALWETWVRLLDWEDPLEKGMATHSSILAWRIRWTVKSVGVSKSWTQLSNFYVTYTVCLYLDHMIYPLKITIIYEKQIQNLVCTIFLIYFIWEIY